ncbi:hypothetical protein IC006_0644 [Sulfuracidifex tepidarius]|uniref:Uncharacterized protein n=1 Tax=Sulfuracidifex tepidarius TaxID=1294262 RepID=A0A510DTE8_9CREN|nr:hypothetical protein [Sulfuracidifex tepidarius]BBG23360.1 hypothetical protein IC006_0644 [Sulfuracidifex tepidarius]
MSVEYLYNMTANNVTISNITIFPNGGLTGVPAMPAMFVNGSQTSQPQSQIATGTTTTTPTTHVPTISHSVSQSLSHTIASSHVLITSTDINLALIGVGISILIGVFLVYRRR